MSFRFSLGRAQIKHFKTALQTLNKIGGELLVEAVPQQLVLRSINTAKSAFLSITYFSHFFESYEIHNTEVVQTVVLSKNVLAIFRSPKIIQIDFVLEDAAARLQATVHTEPEGLIKRYAFNCLDGEVLQATVDRDAYPTVVIAEASELDKLLSSFQHTLDEITLIANPLSAAALANGHKACEMRSFVDPLKAGQEGALLTTLALDTRSVFTSYSHASPHAADVTFNVRDFRAMAALCTALGADVALRLEGAGAPLLVEPHFRGLGEGSETDFSAMLVLSTLTDSQLGPDHQHQVAEPAAGEPGDEVEAAAGAGGQQQWQHQQQGQHQQRGQAQHHRAAAAATPGQTSGFQTLPSPYRDPMDEGPGWDAADGDDAGGGGRAAQPAAAGMPSATGSGRGRRRLPSRQGQGQGQDVGPTPAAPVTAPVAAHAAYAAAAAAEGLPAGAAAGRGGGGMAAPVHLTGGSGVTAPGVQAWPGAGGAGSMASEEDDLPARRRVSRPPRFDVAHHIAAAPAPTGSVGGGGGAGSLPPQDPRRAAAAATAAGASAAQQGFVQFHRSGLQGATPEGGDGGLCIPADSQDPEGLPGLRSPQGRQDQAQVVSPSVASFMPDDPRGSVQPAWQQAQLQQQQHQYDPHCAAAAAGGWRGQEQVQGRGQAQPLSATTGAFQTAADQGGGGGNAGGRTPYGGAGVGIMGSGAGGITPAAAVPQGVGTSDGGYGGSRGGGGPATGAAGASSWHALGGGAGGQAPAHPGAGTGDGTAPFAWGAAAAAARGAAAENSAGAGISGTGAYRQGGHGQDDPAAYAQQQQQQHQHPYDGYAPLHGNQHQQGEQERGVSHAELFGDVGGEGGVDGMGFGEEDDDEEIPPTPPEEQRTRSMGTGVLGTGLGGGAGEHGAGEGAFLS